MYKKADEILSNLPPEYEGDLLPIIRKEFLSRGRTILVFDDDPTGTQTCHDVVVLTSWSVDLIAEELRKSPSILFILTNSRSLPEVSAVNLMREIGGNVKEASRQTKRDILAISRSDSTLRGHFPAEVGALAQALDLQDAVCVLIPAFIEGGRVTIDDVHYIVENGELVPVANTPFAKDRSFGYTHSNVKQWAEEKSKGKIKATDIMSISLQNIRTKGPRYVAEQMSNCRPGDIVLVNAASYRDLEVFTQGLMQAESGCNKFLFRSSATFVPISAGIAPGKIYTPVQEETASRNGSLIVVGSYVPKSTSQLNYLLTENRHEAIEVDVGELLSRKQVEHPANIAAKLDSLIESGRDVVVYTSRKLETAPDVEGSLKINSDVSEYLVNVIGSLNVRPSFIIAKGGITSSDLASKALSSKKGLVLGQAIAGVPVWRLDSESKFSKILYIVFPGNVGGESALWDVWYRFKYNV